MKEAEGASGNGAPWPTLDLDPAAHKKAFVTHRTGTRLTRQTKYLNDINGYCSLAEGVSFNRTLNPGPARAGARASMGFELVI